MREFLFHGKRIDNGEWVEGWYQPPVSWGGSSWGTAITFHHPTEGWLADAEVDPDTVGEFFGKRDKNGRRIFEGDIGRYRQTDGAKRNGTSILCTGKVVYNAETASYAVDSRDAAGCRYFDYFPIKDFEVIGNIHDNPELLEENDGTTLD